MKDRYYVKLFAQNDWYVWDGDGPGSGKWVALCHEKSMAETICTLLNNQPK